MKIKKAFSIPLTACSLLLMASCINSEPKKVLHSGIILQNMDTTVAPRNNFTAYVNCTWMENTKIPSDKASYGIGAMVNDKAQEDIRAIIENAAKGNPAEGSDE